MPELAVDRVVVHPLVLLSVVDHFNRIGKVGNQKRVVGVLLGSWQKKILDVSNSFAVPFDEDDKDDTVWFLDHDYLENMYGMFKKVNARERIVGWYHTGPKLHKNDIAINELMKRYCPNSVLVIIDVKPKDLGLPTEAYISVEEVHDDGTPTSKTFEHVTSEIGAEEAEEVGVEHLLRDIKDTTVGTLSQRITNQDVFNLLPDRAGGARAEASAARPAQGLCSATHPRGTHTAPPGTRSRIHPHGSTGAFASSLHGLASSAHVCEHTPCLCCTQAQNSSSTHPLPPWHCVCSAPPPPPCAASFPHASPAPSRQGHPVTSRSPFWPVPAPCSISLRDCGQQPPNDGQDCIHPRDPTRPGNPQPVLLCLPSLPSWDWGWVPSPCRWGGAPSKGSTTTPIKTLPLQTA
uniref:26S proteasome non-ATPase regulatory subunit 7 n=1 Tax=Taeniopygia guttata TaxID=59729 RepID=H0ZCW8_TAEGU